jgi:hypothetical protein
MKNVIFDIYHDESKEEAYWHGFLFVPRENRDYLLGLLREARVNTDYFYPVHYKKIRCNKKHNSKKEIIIKSWTTIGVSSLQQQKLNKISPFVYLGRYPRKTKPVYKKLQKLIKCKFAIFKEKDRHRKMFFKDDNLRNIEITFKIALKGALHKLFSNENPVTVGNIFIDGDEHYIGEYGRNINMAEILRRLQIERRDYVEFLGDSKIIPQKSDHRKLKNNQVIEDSYLLQLCDILIGGVRFHSFCPETSNVKYRISEPCKNLLEHDQNNIARMKEGRYFNGFILNEAWIKDEEWKFCQLNVANSNNNSRQLSLKF